MIRYFCPVAVVCFIACSGVNNVNAGPAPAARVMCDCNGDAIRDLSDAVYIFSWLFLGSDEPVPLEPLAGPSALVNGDCNGDKARDISDGIYLLDWLFIGGPEPKESILGPTARADIGAAGGSLTSPDGTMTLAIPAGALSETTEITITEVAADQVPDHLLPVEAERVFKLGPDGQQFAQPVTAAVSMAAGSELPVMVLESAGKIEAAAAQRIEIRADGLGLSGQMTHFSYVLTRRVENFTLQLIVDKRELKVGDQVTASYTLTASAQGGRVDCDIDPDDFSSVLERVGSLPGCVDDDVDLFPGTKSLSYTTVWNCHDPGTDTIEVFFGITGFATAFVLLEQGLEYDVTIRAAADVVCKEKDPEGGIPTGVTDLPFNLKKPDGLKVLLESIANFAGAGPFAMIAGEDGLVVMDLPKQLSALNMTSSGPDGSLGGFLLGVQPISRPNPGPNRLAALFGTSPFTGYLRNSIDGGWGFTQVIPQVGYIDASNSGGKIVAEEMVTVAPTRGVHFVKYDAEHGFFNFAPDGIGRARFSGDLRSAVLPSDAAGSPVLVLSANTDGGTTSTVWAHLRDTSQPAVKLFSFTDPDGRQIRCLPVDQAPAALSGLIPTIVTGFSTGTARYFLFDPANPTAVPEVQTLEVGAGAVGVEFGQRADGNPWAVVSNFSAGSFNAILFNAEGTVTGNVPVTLPDGCGNSAHAVPLSYQGKDYVIGTCYDTARYFGLNIRF